MGDNNQKPGDDDDKKPIQTPFVPDMGGFVGDENPDAIIASAAKWRAEEKAGNLEWAKGEIALQEAREKLDAEARKVEKAKQEIRAAQEAQKAQERWDKHCRERDRLARKKAQSDAALVSALASAGMVSAQLNGMVTKLLADHSPVDPSKLAPLRGSLEAILLSLK